MSQRSIRIFSALVVSFAAGIFTLAPSVNAPRAASRGLYILLPEASFETMRRGDEIYAVVCAGCHLPHGEGAIGAGRYPSLAGSTKLEHGAYAIDIVLSGKGAMPPFKELLDDAQIAAVLNYARGAAFGNAFSPIIMEVDVRRARH